MTSIFFLLFSALVSLGIGTAHSAGVSPMDNRGGPTTSLATPAPSDNGGGHVISPMDNRGGP